jgi:hypothetical protein
MLHTGKPVEVMLATIQALDLESVKTRIMDPKLGEGWTRAYADSIERAYKTYLSMLVKNPDDAEDIMLSKDVDEFWHTHILQTIKYHEDCEAVFGKYLHHQPHIGELTEADIARREALAEKTRVLYEREFGDARISGTAWTGVPVNAQGAAVSAVAIGPARAAVSAAAIRGYDAAVSAAAIRANDAAVSAAAIRANNAAVSAAAIRADHAAVSAAAIRADTAAVSAAAIRADNAAVSAAAIRADTAAVSAAAIRADNAAVSAAAIRTERPSVPALNA